MGGCNGNLTLVSSDSLLPFGVDSAFSDESHNFMASGGKRRAQDFRKAYWKSEKENGRRLTPVESDYFRDAMGSKVGITWSEENGSKWFLNLMEGKFDEAVLLCQVKPEESVAIQLPKSFVNRYWHNFSRDEKGEVKFNVVRDRGRFYIRLPEPVGLTDISEFVSKQSVVAAEPNEYK